MLYTTEMFRRARAIPLWAVLKSLGAEGVEKMIDTLCGHAEYFAEGLRKAGFDPVPVEMDVSSRESILNILSEAQKYAEISMPVNAAGVSPSQAPVEAILKVDLYGTAVLLEEVGKVIRRGGAGVTISSQSGWRMPALTAGEDELLAATPAESGISW